jgi:hypothetical protein
MKGNRLGPCTLGNGLALAPWTQAGCRVVHAVYWCGNLSVNHLISNTSIQRLVVVSARLTLWAVSPIVHSLSPAFKFSDLLVLHIPCSCCPSTRLVCSPEFPPALASALACRRMRLPEAACLKGPRSLQVAASPLAAVSWRGMFYS